MDQSGGIEMKNSLIQFRYAVALHKNFCNKLRL